MITMFYAGLCTMLVIFLAVRVARWRLSRRIGLGDGGDNQLLMRVRAHANAVENLPLALLLLGGLELNGYDRAWIHSFGALLLLSRLGHAWGLSHSSGSSRGRMFGSIFTWLLMLTMAAFGIAGYLRQFNAG